MNVKIIASYIKEQTKNSKPLVISKAINFFKTKSLNISEGVLIARCKRHDIDYIKPSK